MKKIILVAGLLVLGLSGCTVGNYDVTKLKVLTPDAVKARALSFINEQLVDTQNQVTLGDVTQTSGVYEINVNLANGQSVKGYMTKDGKYFFTTGVDIDKETEAAKANPQAAPQDSVAAQDQVQIETVTEGTGDRAAQDGDTLAVLYTGKLADGTEFDSSAKHGNQPLVVTLGEHKVIAGWEQGLVGMKVGEKRTLVIPPSLGYGAEGAGSMIPPNATLTFEVELVSIK